MSDSSDARTHAPLAYEPPTISRPPLGVLLGIVGLKMAGLLLVVQGVAALPYLFYFLEQTVFAAPSSQIGAWLAYASGTFVQVGAGVAIFLKAAPLSERMFGQLHDDAGHHFSAQQLLTFLFVAVGLWTTITSLGALLSTIFSFWDTGYRQSIGRSSGSTALMDGRSALLLIVSLAQPVAGLALIWWARSLAALGMSRWSA